MAVFPKYVHQTQGLHLEQCNDHLINAIDIWSWRVPHTDCDWTCWDLRADVLSHSKPEMVQLTQTVTLGSTEMQEGLTATGLHTVPSYVVHIWWWLVPDTYTMMLRLMLDTSTSAS